MANDKIYCSKCGAENEVGSSFCKKCGADLHGTSAEKPSNVWYLLPLLFGILGGIIGYIVIKVKDEKMAKNILYVGLGMSVLGIIFIAAVPSPPPGHVDSGIPGYNSTLVRNYEIIKTEDFSMKALDKPLSAYTSAEINNLPMNIRKEYRVVVPTDISKEELKATLIQVVMDKTSENPDIGAIMIFAYDREEDADDFYTFGRLIWSPDGETFAVPSSIASKNGYSSYKYGFDICDKVGNAYVDRPTEREFEIHDIYYKALMEIPEEDLWEDMHGAEAKVSARVAKELGISEEELSEIYCKVEGYKMK